jgi:hypothetical protein
MSTGASLALIIGSVVAIAAVLILFTKRSGAELAVVWMRPRGFKIAHAFRTAELRADLPDVQALVFCGRWPVAELVSDDEAPRCAACERAVERMEHRHG